MEVGNIIREGVFGLLRDIYADLVHTKKIESLDFNTFIDNLFQDINYRKLSEFFDGKDVDDIRSILGSPIFFQVTSGVSQREFREHRFKMTIDFLRNQYKISFNKMPKPTKLVELCCSVGKKLVPDFEDADLRNLLEMQKIANSHASSTSDEENEIACFQFIMTDVLKYTQSESEKNALKKLSHYYKSKFPINCQSETVFSIGDIPEKKVDDRDYETRLL